jgi:hypothetical protein
MLIIVWYFSNQDFHTFILKGRKENKLGTCDSDDEKSKFCMKQGHYIRDCVLCKEWLEKKGIEEYN